MSRTGINEGLTVARSALDMPGQLVLRQGLATTRTLGKVVLFLTLRQQVLGQAGDFHHLPRREEKAASA